MRKWLTSSIVLAVATLMTPASLCAVERMASGAAVRSAPAEAALYVSDERGGAVLVIDLPSGAVRARIAVGKRPRGLGLSPDRRTLYVALTGSAASGPVPAQEQNSAPDPTADGIGVVDLNSQQLVKVIPSGPDPEAFAVSPDGKMLYVSNEDAATLSFIDVAGGMIVANVAVGAEPEGVAVTRDGKIIFIACEAANAVYVVSASTRKVLARIAVPRRPRSIVLTPDDKLAFVASEIEPAVTVIDPVALVALKTISLAPADGRNVRPMGLALSPSAATLYVTTGRGGSLVEVDVRSATARRTIASIGARPWGVAVSADGSTAFTANGPSGDISVIDLGAGALQAHLQVGASPWGVLYARHRRDRPRPSR